MTHQNDTVRRRPRRSTHEPPNPSGLCMCGCGSPVQRATKTSTKARLVRGEFVRFLPSHNRRQSGTDYSIEDRGFVTPCHVWQLGIDKRGYGTFRGKKAHRVKWEEANGPIPDGMQLDHLCRVRACCNPEHLELVTAAENSQRGLKAKLTPDQVREIRTLIATTGTNDVAAQFGITREQVWNIVTRRCWKNVS